MGVMGTTIVTPRLRDLGVVEVVGMYAVEAAG